MFARSITAARRKAVPALALVAVGVTAVGLGAAPAVATSVPPTSGGGIVETSEPPTSEGQTVVVDQGDLSQPVDLAVQPAAGSAATNTSVSTVAGTLSLTGTEERSVDLAVITTVVESAEVTASDDAGMTMRRLVESYDVADNSSEPGVGESFASDEELGELVGVELDYVFGPGLRLQDVTPAQGVELTSAQQAAVDEVIADGIGKAQLPSEPVGVGAQWTATLPGGSSDVVGTYTLVSLVDGEYTIEVSVSGDAAGFLGTDLPRGFDEITGSMEGSGTLVGSVDEPLVRTIELDFSLDVTLSGEAGEMTMDLTMTESEVATAS